VKRRRRREEIRNPLRVSGFPSREDAGFALLVKGTEKADLKDRTRGRMRQTGDAGFALLVKGREERT
jgi:hypothetical protein